MRPESRAALESYGKFAKDKKVLKKEKKDAKQAAETDETKGGVEELAEPISALDRLVSERAKASLTDKNVQREIYALQEEKQEIMTQMREELASLDEPEKRAEGESHYGRSVTSREGKYFCRVKGGKEVEVTAGDMITDLAWGIEYRLDGSVPRATRKSLIIERAKHRIQDLLDRQISLEESANAGSHETLRQAYARSMEDKESGNLPFGIIAERMLSQMLRKEIIDNGLPYKYQRADAYQDIGQKMDFIIKRLDYARGVKVEEGEGLGSKGIQFTLNSKQEVLEHKKRQIQKSKERLGSEDKIDDIVLVQMASAVFGKIYDEWKTKKPPGGPDSLLDDETRKTILAELLRGMEPDEEEETK